MIYKITSIEFDFDYEDVTEEEQNEIINDTTSYLWDSPSEEELVNVITNNTGWTVTDLQYEKV
jgi:predicted hydrolase (HD superfamily)